MAAGSIAAGLMDGYVRGLGLRRQMQREDEEAKTREEERAYLREQRALLRQQQEVDAEIDRRLSAVPTTSEKWGSDYSGAAASGAPMRDDEGNVMPGVQSTPRSYRDVAADQAAAVRGVGGRRGVAMANQLQQFVNAETDREEAAKDRGVARELQGFQLAQARALNAWRQAGLAYSRGDLGGALRQLSGGYDHYPDGRKLVTTQDGQFGIATPDGKWVEPPVPINRQNVEAALTYAQRFLDPSAWAQFQGVRQGDQKLSNDNAYQTGMLGIYGDRNNLERAVHEARLAGRGGYGHAPERAQVVNLSDDGRTIFGIRGDRGFTIPVPAGFSGALPPKLTGARPERDAAQKAWLDAESKLIAGGARPDEIRQQQTAFFARRGFAPPEAEAVLMAGVNPTTKKPLTAADVAEFNRRYPQSAVQPSELPWLKK